MKKWIIIGAVALIVLSGGGYLGYRLTAGRIAASAETAAPEEFRLEVETDIVSVEGRVVPIRQATLAFLSGGRVDAVLVAEGDRVGVGDPLVRLETADQEIAVRAAETAVALAEADLASAQVGLVLAQLGLDAAHLAVRDAEADLALVLAGATDEQVAVTESAVAVAEAAIEGATGNRALVLEGASDAEIAAARAELARALAEYDVALKSYQPILQDPDTDADDGLQASLRLEAARAALAAAQSALDRLLAGATAAEWAAAEGGVMVAANQRDVAQAQLDLLLAGARSEHIAVAEASVASATTAVAEAEGRLASARTAVERAEAALLEARAGLAAAENELDKRTLTAPFTGIVAAVHLKEGEIAQVGPPAVILADFTGWQVETTDLTEVDVVALGPGQPVAVEVDAFPGVMLRGEVREIATSSAVPRLKIPPMPT